MRALERTAGVLSLGAALVHGGLTPSHLDAWWGYGLVFMVAAACQAVLGLALLVEVFPQDDPAAPLARRWILGAGAVGNALLVSLYLVTRTVGIPVGPEAGVVEGADPLGVTTLLLELATVALLLGALWSARRERLSSPSKLAPR